MDLDKVLAQLRAELANLDAAIISLESIQQEGGGRHRGRTPKTRSEIPETAPSLPTELPAPPSGREHD
jgi:hypothetical protein